MINKLLYSIFGEMMFEPLNYYDQNSKRKYVDEIVGPFYCQLQKLTLFLGAVLKQNLIGFVFLSPI